MEKMCSHLLYFARSDFWPSFVMVSLQIQTLIQQSKNVTHLLQVQSLVLKSAIDYNPKLVSHFVSCACSISVHCAKIIFDNIPIVPPIFAWNSIIKAVAKSSTPLESVKYFCKLQKLGLRANNFTYPFVLKACGRCSLAAEGGVIHSLILKMGFDSDLYISNTLLKLYDDCGIIEFARQVFDEMTVRDVVSWSSLIAAYVAW